MKAEIYTVIYVDKDAAALVYRKVHELAEDLGIVACGMEKAKSKSRRTRTYLKLMLVLEPKISKDLPAVLKVIQDSLKKHPLYSYLSFDYTAVPTSLTDWNFESYDDLNYQKIFIQKRTKG